MEAPSVTDEKQVPAALNATFRQMVEELRRFSALEAQQEASPHKVRVNKSISTIALVYEKMRNAVGYQQEHLLRRIAIDRYFRRRVALRQEVSQMGDSVVRELIRSGYLNNNALPETLIIEVQRVIDRYAAIFPLATDEVRELLFGLLSVEMERVVSSHAREEIILGAFHRYLRIHLNLKTAEEDRTLIAALYEGFFQTDHPTQLFYLVRHFLPQWDQCPPEQAESMKDQLFAAVAQGEQAIHSRTTERTHYTKVAKQYYPLFLLIRTIVVRQPVLYAQALIDRTKLAAQVYDVASRYRTEAAVTLRRGVTKAVIFVLITKVVLGLVFEVPYDIYAHGAINYLPLILNITMPILLLIVSVFLASLPGPANTQRLTLLSEELLYKDEAPNDNPLLRTKPPRGSAFSEAMSAWYTITFVLITAGLIWLLWKLNFNLVSGALFFFFLSTVSFLAFRIRTSVAELTVYHEDEGGLVVLSDFFLLPFLQVGFWLSASLKRANVFLFLFDFVLETPFKSLLELLEQWTLFIREKKDEMRS